jgi:hypothetical protein
MKITRRWKIVLLCAAAASTLTVIFWAAFVFTAIALRVRCARELAERAQPLGEVTIGMHDLPDGTDLDAINFISLSGTIFFGTGNDDSLTRLEQLQNPSLATLYRNLWGHDQVQTEVNLLPSQTIQWATTAPAGSATTVAVAATAQPTTGQTVTAQALPAPTAVGQPLPAPAAPAPPPAGQTAAAPANLNLTFSSTVSAGQALSKIVLWDTGQNANCYSVTDTHGEKLLIASRQITPEPDSRGVVDDAAPTEYELLLIDASGRIIERTRVQQQLVGKLAEPRGLADQLVFGTPRHIVPASDGSPSVRVVGPGSIGIIENGKLKMVDEP